MLGNNLRRIIRTGGRAAFRPNILWLPLMVLSLFIGLSGRTMAAEISMTSLLDDMTNLLAMAEFPNPPYVTRQFSSYDRTSTTPADPKTWFANNDCGNYLRIEDRDGRKEHVMADMQGPGAIVRNELLLEFKVPKAAKYQVFGRFLKAVDYGIIQLAINGKPAGKPIDFFHDGVIHTAQMPLGTFELRQGPNELSAVVVGANPKAVKEYMFGLDYVLIKAVK